MEEEKPKTSGRGIKLIEKVKARSPGQFPEAELSPSKVSQDPSTFSVVDIEKSVSQKPQGRGSLFSQLKSHSQELGESSVEIGVQGHVKPEIKKGRGFLLKLAKQSVVTSDIQTELSKTLKQAAFVETTFEKEMQKISLKSEEAETEGPPIIQRGIMGEKVNVAVNYVTLKTDPGKGIFEYEVRFVPEIVYIAFRYKLISQHFEPKKGIRCYDGGEKLYMPEKVISNRLVIDAKHPNDQSSVQIIITFKRQMRLKECTQLYNILFNNCSKVLKLTRLGRQHYDHTLSHQIPQHKLEVWPGYVTAVEEFEGGIYLCCDIRHRVLRSETAYNVISSFAGSNAINIRNETAKELIGQCVLTRYNNNLYRIDDIDWNNTPLSTFKLSSGEEITFLEYYRKQYGLEIKVLKQPLLINRPKMKRNNESSPLICLVPELCYLTGLTDKMRKDMRVMKEIATYTRVTPVQRNFAFKKFLENLQTNKVAQEMLNAWGLTIADEPLKTDARILPQENIILKNEIIPSPANLEWSKYIRNNGVYRGKNISHWLLVHTKKDINLAESFWNMLTKVGPGLGIDIRDPIIISIENDRIDSYIRAVRKHMTPIIQVRQVLSELKSDIRHTFVEVFHLVMPPTYCFSVKEVAEIIEMVVCLCPSQREDRYSAIKKLCCRDIPVPSQIVNCRTISRDSRMLSVVQNIALQMNNKIGGASWAVQIPLKNTMICGIDSYHDADRKGYSVGAFVASVHPDFTQWYSKTCIQEPKQELVDGLKCSFAHGLRKYLEINNTLPERIFIFRDGVGDGQLSVVQNYEVSQFLETCELVSKRYKPKFSFIVVQKRINTKFYQILQNDDLFENPKSGCVLDHTVTRRNYYDFFLVSQHVSCGTATPSHYIVLYDTSNLRPDLMQRLTYKCCHMYYNWSGTIRVPAPCQYAHKLAYLVGQNIKELPKDILDDKLFYL